MSGGLLTAEGVAVVTGLDVAGLVGDSGIAAGLEARVEFSGVGGIHMI